MQIREQRNAGASRRVAASGFEKDRYCASRLATCSAARAETSSV